MKKRFNLSFDKYIEFILIFLFLNYFANFEIVKSWAAVSLGTEHICSGWIFLEGCFNFCFFVEFGWSLYQDPPFLLLYINWGTLSILCHLALIANNMNFHFSKCLGKVEQSTLTAWKKCLGQPGQLEKVNQADPSH